MIDIENIEVRNTNTESSHRTAYVCDLRFLKPKLDGKNEMVMFSPNFSYKISNLIEKFLPEKLPNSIVLV
jgi:hypothetical protein